MFWSNLLCANRSLIWELIFIVSPKSREPIRKILEAQYQLRSMRHEGLFLLEGDQASGVGLPPSSGATTFSRFSESRFSYSEDRDTLRNRNW